MTAQPAAAVDLDTLRKVAEAATPVDLGPLSEVLRSLDAAKLTDNGVVIQRSTLSQLIAELTELRAASRWIPCEERMPAAGEEVAFVALGRRCVGNYRPEAEERDEWSDLLCVDMWGDCDHYSSDQVTHWAPLSAPPEVAK